MQNKHHLRKGDSMKAFSRTFAVSFFLVFLILGLGVAFAASPMAEGFGSFIAGQGGAGVGVGAVLALVLGGVGAAGVMIRIAGAVRKFREQFEGFTQYAKNRFGDDPELKVRFDSLILSADELTEYMADLLETMRMKVQAQRLRDIIK